MEVSKLFIPISRPTEMVSHERLKIDYLIIWSSLPLVPLISISEYIIRSRFMLANGVFHSFIMNKTKILL